MLGDISTKQEWQKCRGRLLPQESLSGYTSWRVGGPASYVYIPADLADTVSFLQRLPPEMMLLWLGLGSNTLVRDGGVDAVAIITQGALASITLEDSVVVRAEAGVSCAQIARYTARNGLMGLEFMAGIPGTVGGALAMNAGCYGGETWQRVCQVETINREGVLKIRPASDFTASYRHVVCPENEWFVAGYFKLTPGDKKQALDNIRVLLEKRNAAQPTSWPNGGSVFRNPKDNFAAKLIEQSGLKGFKLGGASVSEKHANFIINEGEASAADIEKLIEHVADVVEQNHKIRLIPEVRIVGKSLPG
ncbi:MAG: UDP-N-acetylmuramate dehydrogenase [Gammaproteobacteria bacterium]|nr:UDP-N-acetylmuramate dehydrogenase [Gammaproteobacteria bacterium]